MDQREIRSQVPFHAEERTPISSLKKLEFQMNLVVILVLSNGNGKHNTETYINAQISQYPINKVNILISLIN